MVDYSSDVAYGANRLVDSIALVDGIPRYIYNLTPSFVHWSPLGSGTVKKTSIKKLNNSNIPLGFVNTHTRAKYVVRIPKKQYKQGLRQNNLTVLPYNDNFNPLTKGFVNCVLGIYPSVEDCMELVTCGEMESCAFSRKYSLSLGPTPDKYELTYKIYSVGTISITNHNIVKYDLFEKYSYLKEDLEEVINNA